MEGNIIRQQMEARLLEFIMYYRAYQENAEKHKDLFEKHLPDSEKEQYKQFLSEWDPLDETAQEMIYEIDLRAQRLKIFWEQVNETVDKNNRAILARLTHTHNGITIVRRPLQYSSYAASAGYESNSKCLDIEYQTGKLYRYQQVPIEVFEKILTLKSLRDMKAIIDQYEFEKLN